MKPHYKLIKELMKKHVQITDMLEIFDETGITMPFLNEISFFDIALDIMGFPPDTNDRFDPERGFDPSETYDRSKLGEIAHCMKMEEVDAFVEKLYADYDQLLLERPHLKGGPAAHSVSR